jgi:hypothetical protein
MAIELKDIETRRAVGVTWGTLSAIVLPTFAFLCYNTHSFEQVDLFKLLIAAASTGSTGIMTFFVPIVFISMALSGDKISLKIILMSTLAVSIFSLNVTWIVTIIYLICCKTFGVYTLHNLFYNCVIVYLIATASMTLLNCAFIIVSRNKS